MIIKKGRQFLELPTLQVFIKNNLPKEGIKSN